MFLNLNTKLVDLQNMFWGNDSKKKKDRKLLRKLVKPDVMTFGSNKSETRIWRFYSNKSPRK